jgi:hypothetical protein
VERVVTEQNDDDWQRDAWRAKYEALLKDHVASERERWREITSLTHKLEQAIRERDEARDERDSCRKALDAAASAHERDLIAIWRVLGNYHEPPSSSESVIDAVQLMRDERRQLRARLVECRPWVGVLPYPNTPGFSEMIAIRDIADDTLAEVPPWSPKEKEGKR